MLPYLFTASLGFAVIFSCLALAMRVLGRVYQTDRGPGWWALGLFFNSLGFLTWAGTVLGYRLAFFALGEMLHMFGFWALIWGAGCFTKKPLGQRHVLLLTALAVGWGAALALVPYYHFPAVFVLMLLRCVLFVSAGRMILRSSEEKMLGGRRLAGWSLMAWGATALFFPFLTAVPWAGALAFGLVVGLHVTATMGMVIMVVERLRARVEAGEEKVKRLEGLLPICSHCKKIRDANGEWQALEVYIGQRSDATFSHGLCQDCLKELYPEMAGTLLSEKA
jgi:hypothetical protein